MIQRSFPGPHVNQHRAHFPAYPLGTELSSDEQALAAALGWLQLNTATTGKRIRTLLHAALNSTPSGFEKALARMGLEKPTQFKQRLIQRLLSYALQQTIRIDFESQ